MTTDEILARLKNVTKQASGWMASCPAHPDTDPSLSVREGEDGKTLVKCFAGCSFDAVVKASGLEPKDFFPDSDGPTSGGASLVVEPSKAGSSTSPGLTLKELSAAKKLPEAFLREQGLSDCNRNGAAVVRMPYFNADGELQAIRFRLGMTGQRFAWRTGAKALLYGLQRLKEIRAAGWVLLVEGESDCWTAWHYGLPALGIPGKSTWKESWRDYFVGLQVYLWQEPDAEDLSRRVFADIPNLLIILAPQGVKDISDAHIQGSDVVKLLEPLKEKAIPAELIRREEEVKRTSELREIAASLLASEDPLQIVNAAFRGLGYGGDLRYPLITYLACTSRLLAMRTGAMPVHLLLVGSPSAGKSYTLQLVLKLFPAASFYVIDAGSPRVLIYDTADLRHRVTVFSEADSLPAGEDNPAASAIRNLLQDHHLHYKVPVRDPKGGDFVIRDVDKPGPTVLITTAVKRLGSQLDSRLFSLEVPDDHERVRQALKTQAGIELHGVGEPDAALVAYQEYLQALAPWDVVVPFAMELSEAIGKSLSAPRILRDFQRLLSLIKAAAILRHPHRQHDAAGRLIATVEDYATVHSLVGDMYESSVTGASPRVREVIKAVDELQKTGRTPISVTAIANHLSRHKGGVARCVGVAIKNDWLVNTQQKKGLPAQLVLGEEVPPISGLPDPGGVAVSQSKPAEAEGWEEGEL